MGAYEKNQGNYNNSKIIKYLSVGSSEKNPNK